MVNIWSIISQQQTTVACPQCASPTPANMPLCASCRAQLPRITHSCPVCALPRPFANTSPCGECLRDPPAFDRVRSFYRYASPLDQLIAQFKYQQQLASGRLLARLLGQALKPLPEITTITLLLPMPLHPQRLRERGFNQAAELTRHLSAELAIPWRSDLLTRQQPGASQREAKRAQRWKNVRRAFHCLPLQGKVAIIDDVVTTGATARAAAQCVRRAGAETIEIWALARTPAPGEREQAAP